MKRISPVTLLILLLFFCISCSSPTPPSPTTKLKSVLITHAVRLQVAETKAFRTASEMKMQSGVLELSRQYMANGNTFTIPKAILISDFDVQPSFAKVDLKNNVYLYIYPRKYGIGGGRPYATDTVGADIIKKLEDTLSHYNVSVTNPDTIHVLSLPFVQGWVPAQVIDSIANLPIVAHLAIVTDPLINDLPDFRASQRTRSDFSQRSLDAGEGKGMNIGIISDDCGSMVESDGIAPMNSVPAPTAGHLPWLPAGIKIHTLDDGWNGRRSHEGLAMMEVAHDMAPQADLFFATGYGVLDASGNNNLGMLNFVNAIDQLAKKCNVIADDIQYLEEPAFENGPIAKRMEDLSDPALGDHAIFFCSAAGNWAKDVYSFTFDSIPNQKIGSGTTWQSYTIQDPSSGVYRSQFTIPDGNVLDVMLQWDDPYVRAVAKNDFDLYLVDVASQRIIQWSTNIQDGSDSGHSSIPFEHMKYVPNPCYGSKGYKLFISQYAKDPENPTPRMKLLIRGLYDGDQPSNLKSLFGHAADTACIACGAVNPFEDYWHIEDFSSLGPVEIVNTAASSIGTPDNHRPLDKILIHPKPDLAAVDGVATTVRHLEYFKGTSAASPVMAGAIASLLSMHFTPMIVREALREGCVHYGESGMNDTYGQGRYDFYRSVAIAYYIKETSSKLFGDQTDPPASPFAPVLPQVMIPKSITTAFHEIFVSVSIDGLLSHGVKIFLKYPGATVTKTIASIPSSAGAFRGFNAVFGDGGMPFGTGAMNSPTVGYFKSLEPVSTPFLTTSDASIWNLVVTDESGAAIQIKDWSIYVR